MFPALAVAGERSSIAWKRAIALACAGSTSAPAWPCRSSANIAISCSVLPATSLPIEFSGPGVSPLERAEMARMPVYFSPEAFTAYCAR